MKTAIHCKTQEEWDKVTKKLGYKWEYFSWNTYKENSCINTTRKGMNNVEFYKNRDYNIIPASQFLNNNIMTEELKELPKYFAINSGNCKHPLWKKYIKWLNKTYRSYFLWEGTDKNAYYGYDGNINHDGTNLYKDITHFSNSPVELTLEHWDSIINQKTNNMKLEITKERILEAANKCSTAKETLQTLFPEVFEDDKYIDLSSARGRHLRNSNGFNTDDLPDTDMIQIRQCGKFGNKGFYLDKKYNWELVIDSPALCLIPTKK